MKENSLDSHRGKVAESKAGAAAKQETTSATNFDDDYNEWELGIGDLIIDLDADIEKNNEKSVSGQGTGGGAGAHPIVQPHQPQQQQPPQSQTQQQASATAGATTTFSMASAKGGRMNTATVEHHATVDKGLKMKIKRTKPTKTSEAKHEIVKSDTKPASPVEAVNGTAPAGATTPNAVDSKSKHVSSKGRGGSHREKKDRTKDKEKSVSSSKAPDVNGVMNTVSNATLPPPPPTATIKLTSSSVNMASISSPTVNLGIPTSVVSLSLTNTSNTPSATSNSGQHSGSTVTSNSNSNSLPSMPTLSVKLDPKFPILPNNSFPTVKTEDISRSVPAKRMRTNQDKPEKPVEKVDGTTSPRPPEMQDICIGTSVGTITDPDCLGPCEPGTSVTLEGIVWHETEGGVLVVNVTWRGKTYVGTLLDCTKHDWAPPRFCESPTSDVETRTPKGRGKRGRGGNNTSVDMTNYTETRSSVHSKLRNPGKGRRSNAPFPSPVKTEGSPIVGMKRKGRPPELELRESELRTSKRSRSQSRGASTNSSTPPEHPSSPVLIECPKPNCKKRYRHINGLRYHQAHAHHESGSGVEDSLDEQTKDLSSDNEESTPESASVPQSPGATSEKNVRSSPRPFTGKAPPPPEKKSLSNPPPTSTAASVTPTPPPTPTNSETYPPPASLPCSPVAAVAAVTSAVTMPVASDLNTLATVAVSDSKTTVKVSGVLRFGQASPRQAATIATEGDPATTLSTSPVVSSVAPVAPAAAATTTTIAATPNATSVQGSQRAVASAPQSPASQVYQFTHAPIGSLTTTTVSTVRSPTTTSTVSVATTNITSTTSVCSPPAVSANFNASAVAATVVDKQKIKPDKPDKLMLKPPQTMPVPGLRPVGPPPVNPQMVSGAANLSVSPQQPTLVPGGVPVHTNLASSLKPIQPKVGMMGDGTVSNQVLDGTKKEKSKHKKKSKDKEKERKLGEISPSQPESKSQGLDSMDKLNGNVYSKISDILLKEGVGEPVSPRLQNPNYPLTPLPRNVDSPLEVSTADGASTANENVQSPAYSDISDANDTAPVLESEVPSKEKEEEKAKVPSEPTPPPAHNLGAYGMYYSYRQPPYLVPSVPAQSSAQPAVGSGQVPSTDKVKESAMDKVEVRMKDQQKQWTDREQPGGVVPATAEVEKKDGGGNSAAGGAANQTNMSEYQLQQQKLLQQQQYAYQYGGYSYPYSMDPTYHMQYMSDPQLKQQLEKCMEERERFYKDPFEQRQKQSSPKDPVDKNKPESVKIKVEASEKRKACPSTEQLMKHVQQQMPVASAMSGKEREQRMPPQANKLDAAANPSLKEKQNENHQILKENIELKTQMDNKAKYDRFDTSKYDQLMYRPDDVQRYYQLYQEKYMDQQPKMDGARRKDDSLVPKPSLNEKSHCAAKDPTKQPPPSSHTTSLPMSSPKMPSGPPKEPLALKEAVKKETGSVVDVTKSTEGSDAKDKREREADRSKQSEGQKPTMETQGPPPPTSSYAYMHPSYMQSSPYSTIPFDHSVYRNMLMTPGPYPSSPYLHPQMRYHVPQAEPQPDMTPKLHPSGPTKALDLLQHHASQYYTHKIHELQERALKSPPPAVIQPAPNTKAVESSSVIKSDATTPAGPHEQRRSPPLQRHLHTHHHTHVGVGVGVGYPIIGQYDPYATIIASQQAAAVAAASSSSTLK